MKYLFKIVLGASFLLSLLFFLLAFLNSNAAIDIQQHDMYFVLSLASFYTMLGAGLLLKASIIFFIRNKKKGYRNRFLGGILLLEMFILGFLLWMTTTSLASGVPERYHRFDSFQSFGEFPSYFIQLLISLLILYLINQVFFVLVTSLVIFGSKDDVKKREN